MLSSLLERGERRVALEALCDRSSALRSEPVVVETANTESVRFSVRGADRKASAIVWIGDSNPLEVCDLGLAQDGSECRSSFWSELVSLQTASTGAGRVHVKGR